MDTIPELFKIFMKVGNWFEVKEPFHTCGLASHLNLRFYRILAVFSFGMVLLSFQVLAEDRLQPRTLLEQFLNAEAEQEVFQETIDICKELLEPNPQRRRGMGRGGAKDVMMHPFFTDHFAHPEDMHDPFTWDSFLFKQMHPPVTPPAFQPYSADSIEPTPEYDGEDVGCFITWDK